MAWADATIEQLQRGYQATLKVHGNAMMPIVGHDDEIVMEPVTFAEVKVGDLVLCECRGVTSLRQVKHIGPRQLQVANAKGATFGFTDKVYGRRV